jgi:hypothetical protein
LCVHSPQCDRIAADIVRPMTQPPSITDFSARAQSGDLEWLGEFVDLVDAADDGEEAVALAYKWLCIAADHGHDEADDMIEDLLNGSMLAYDDDRVVVGSIHFELGLAYLRGAEGLPADHELGRGHLEEAREAHWPWTAQGADEVIGEARGTLDAEQCAVFDAVYAADRHHGSRTP